MKMICCILSAILMLSCSDKETNNTLWSEQDAVALLGSIEISELIAAYNDVDGLALIINTKHPTVRAVKLTKVPMCPVIIDSLLETKTKLFQSIKYHTLYSINDSEVVSTYFQKIIHPSSNWQGQTPWQEVIVSHYPRLDRNLNK